MYAGGPDVIVIEREYRGSGLLTGHTTGGNVIVLYVREPIRRSLYESQRKLDLAIEVFREDMERWRLRRWFEERQAWPELEPEPPPAGAILGRLATPRLLARARGRRPARSRPGMRRARDLARLAP
jgi:hypothetical protein